MKIEIGGIYVICSDTDYIPEGSIVRVISCSKDRWGNTVYKVELLQKQDEKEFYCDCDEEDECCCRDEYMDWYYDSTIDVGETDTVDKWSLDPTDYTANDFTEEISKSKYNLEIIKNQLNPLSDKDSLLFDIQHNYKNYSAIGATSLVNNLSCMKYSDACSGVNDLIPTNNSVGYITTCAGNGWVTFTLTSR